MKQEENAAERLEAAISALSRGEPFDEVVASLPAELRPRLAAAARLMQVRGPVGASGPRPTFALGLEEQLRTDLRLAQSRPAPRLSRFAVRNLLVVAIAAVVLLYLGVGRAGPGAPLYPMRQLLEETRSTLHLTHQARGQAFLDLGWQRIDILRRLLDRDVTDPAVLQPLALGVTEAFSAALDAAERSGDDMFARRVASQTWLAAAEVARLRKSGDPIVAQVVGDLSGDLGAIVSDDRFVAILAPPRGPAASATDEVAALVTTVAPTPEAGAVTPSPPAVSETALPTPSVLPQTTPITPDPPLPTATLTPTPFEASTATTRPSATVVYPPTRERDEPTETDTPEPPTATPEVNAPSETPTTDPRTPTRDSHPVTTTPQSPIVPTATPLGTTISPDLTPIVPPTDGPTQGPGDRQATPVPPAP